MKLLNYRSMVKIYLECRLFRWKIERRHSMEFNPMFSRLENQGVYSAYMDILQNLYQGATSTLKLYQPSYKFKLKGGVC